MSESELEALREALRRDPLSPELWSALLVAGRRAGRAEGEAAALLEALPWSPERPPLEEALLALLAREVGCLGDPALPAWTCRWTRTVPTADRGRWLFLTRDGEAFLAEGPGHTRWTAVPYPPGRAPDLDRRKETWYAPVDHPWLVRFQRAAEDPRRSRVEVLDYSRREWITPPSFPNPHRLEVKGFDADGTHLLLGLRMSPSDTRTSDPPAGALLDLRSGALLPFRLRDREETLRVGVVAPGGERVGLLIEGANRDPETDRLTRVARLRTVEIGSGEVLHEEELWRAEGGGPQEGTTISDHHCRPDGFSGFVEWVASGYLRRRETPAPPPRLPGGWGLGEQRHADHWTHARAGAGPALPPEYWVEASPVEGLAFSEDGAELVTRARGSLSLRVWDLSRGLPVAEPAAPPFGRDRDRVRPWHARCVVEPDVLPRWTALRLVDHRAGTVLRECARSKPGGAVAPDQSWAVRPVSGTTVEATDSEGTRRWTRELPPARGRWKLEISPDGAHALGVTLEASSLLVLDAAGVVREAPLPEAFDRAREAERAQHMGPRRPLPAERYDDLTILGRLGSGELLLRLAGGLLRVDVGAGAAASLDAFPPRSLPPHHRVGVAGDGSRIGLRRDDGAIEIRALPEGTLLIPDARRPAIREPEDPAAGGVALAPDGRRLAYGEGNAVRIVDLGE